MLSEADFSAHAISLLMVCTAKDRKCDEMPGSSFTAEDWTVRGAAGYLRMETNGPVRTVVGPLAAKI